MATTSKSTSLKLGSILFGNTTVPNERPFHQPNDFSPILPLGCTSKEFKLPDRLVVRKDGKWDVTEDKSTISSSQYLYVSYLEEHLEGSVNFELDIESICDRCDLKAYWLDRACRRRSDDSKDRLETFCKLGDIIRGASRTLVFICSGNRNPRSPIWSAWGSRTWTLPELAFSRDLMYKCGEGEPVSIDKGQMCKFIYDWEYQDVKTKLVYIYSNLESFSGKNSEAPLNPFDLVVPLIGAIWETRRDNSDSRSSSISSLEKVYALMAFVPHQIGVIEQEDAAFLALMTANNWNTYNLSPSRRTGWPPALTRAFDKISISRNFFYDRPEILYPILIMRYDRGVQSFLCEDKTHAYKYAAISYLPADDIDIEEIKEMAEYLSVIHYKLDAYWLDCQCVSGTHEKSDLELYHIADACLQAKETVILFPNLSVSSLNPAWKEWGERIWSLPEILLSFNLSYSTNKRSVVPISKKEALMKAYGSNKYAILAEHFEQEKTVHNEELLPCLMSVIWRNSLKMCGKLLVDDVYGIPPGEKKFPEYKAERVYALMTFMPVRIFPSETETEMRALERLIIANGFSVFRIRTSLQTWRDEHFKQESFYSELDDILNDIQIADREISQH